MLQNKYILSVCQLAGRKIMPPPKGTAKAEQSQATIEKLIEVAFIEFSQKGFANTATEAIVRKAGVTRGALYHHFEGKRGLFLAVFEKAQAQIGRRIAARAEAADDPWEQLVAGCRAFLQAFTDPALQQIVVIDAPAVLDWNTYREVDETMPGSGFSLLKAGIQELTDHELIEPLSEEAVAHLLSGAMDEAAVWIAKSEDPAQALAQAQRALESLLSGLRSSKT
jgi:AcrR family transcriptional regulator